MRHIHAELIKAWADGAEIQFKSKEPFDDWQDCTDDPDWNETEGECYYRIKPEPKPDVVEEMTLFWNKAVKFKPPTINVSPWLNDARHYQELGNFKLTFDGETGELKSAEVLK